MSLDRNKAYQAAKLRALTGQSASQDPSLGWADNIASPDDAVNLLKRADVLADLRQLYKDRDGFEGDDDQLRDKFMTDRTWRNVNTVSMGRDVKDAFSMSPEQAARLARAQKLYDAYPNFYEDGGRGASGLAQNVGAALADPLNLIGFGSGGVAAKAAMTAATRGAVRSGTSVIARDAASQVARRQILMNGIKAGAKAGAKSEAAASAIAGAVQDAAMQTRNQEIGLQDEFSTSQLLGSTAMNAAAGAVLGAGFGGLAAPFGGKVSRGTERMRKSVFGDFTQKLGEPKTLSSATEDLDTQTASTGVVSQDKDAILTDRYIAAQREQYQRNLDAIIDEIRAESGDAGLANWRGARMDEKAKTETMKLADEMQANRNALEELYTWPKTKASIERQLETLSLNENPKPEAIERMAALSDKISRGDDAYNAIIRAANNGKESELNKVLSDWSKYTKDIAAEKEPTIGVPLNATLDAVNPTAAIAPAKPAEGEAPAFVSAFPDEAALTRANEVALKKELDKITTAKSAGSSIDPAYEQSVLESYKALSGADYVPTPVSIAPEPAPVAGADTAFAVPEDASLSQIQDAIGAISKRYSAISNQISRINKSIENGKAAPDAGSKIAQLSTERDQLSSLSKDLKDRLAAAENAPPPPPTVLSSIELAGNYPLDVDGAASALVRDYNFDTVERMKEELADFLRKKKPANKDARAATVREFVANKITESRAIDALDSAFSRFTGATALVPTAMRQLLALDSSIPADLLPSVLAQYEKYLNEIAPTLLARYFVESPDLDAEDVLSLIEQNHGKDMADFVRSSLSNDDKPITQSMSAPSGPIGWDKLTPHQRDTITAKMERARERLNTMLAGKMISPKRIDEMLATEREQMVIAALYKDFDAAIPSVTGRIDAEIITDPGTGALVSGKVWDRMAVVKDEQGKVIGRVEQPITNTRHDKFGLQSILRKAPGGRASGIDEHGDVYIEHPFFGNLFVRDIVRNGDGSIDFSKTTDGKYVTKQNEDGSITYIAKRYDPAESARRANEEAMIQAANGRLTRVTKDVANLKAGQKGVTQKQLKAAEVEAARSSPNRAQMNKSKSDEPINEEQEALNKAIRERVRSAVIKDAVASASISKAPEVSVRENLASAEEALGEPVSTQDVEKAWTAVETDARMDANIKTKTQLILQANENYRLTNDIDAFVKEVNDINARFTEKATKPKASVDKPAGARREPRVYVHNGYEVDVRNHFTSKKTSDSTYSVSFMNEKVGDLTINKDNSATLLYRDNSGNEFQVRTSDLDKMADTFPRAFSEQIMAAGKDGKLAAAAQKNNGTYPLDWKTSATWGKVSRTVPVESIVEKSAAITGPVEDFKTNLDASAINLDIPKGHALAIHFTSGKFKGVTRVENLKAETPQTIGKILGNQRDESYTVGFVPEGTRSQSRDATLDFKPLDANDEVYLAGAPESPAKQAGVDVDDFGQIDLSSIDKVSINQLDLPSQFRDRGLNTLANVQNVINEYENVPWTKIADEAQYVQFMQDISSLYEVRAKYAPKGIKLPTASRIQSMKQWERVMANYDDVTKSTGIDILRRLSYMDRNLPQIVQANSGNNAYALPQSGRIEANQIFLNPNSLNPDGTGSALPQPVALLHEVGHWAYMNVLTDADRMNFWSSLGKYFQDGQLDMSAIRARLPGLSPDAEAMSPAEFFANQFVQWGITEGKVNNIPLWTKMARKIVHFARALGVRLGATDDRAIIDSNLVDIDQDMAELFTKILPESDPMYYRYVKIHQLLQDVAKIKNDSRAKVSSLAADTLIALDSERSTLDNAIQSSDASELINSLNQAAQRLYGMVGGTAGANKHKPVKGMPETGQNRLRLFDGKGRDGKWYNGTARVRRELLGAVAEWKDFRKQVYAKMNMSPAGDADFSTSNVTSEFSGDLNSSFESQVDLQYSMLDNDLVGALQLQANTMMKAMAVAQDEARAVILRNADIDGKKLRLAKDGTWETFTPAPYTKYQKSKGIRRAKEQAAALRKATRQVFDEINGSVSSAADRDSYPAQMPEGAVASQSVSTMGIDDLTKEYKSLAGIKNQRKSDLEKEIKARFTEYHDLEIKPPPQELEGMEVGRLQKELLSSIKRGRPDDTRMYASALAWKTQNTPQPNLLPTTSTKVKKAAKIVKQATETGTTDNGIPQNAPVQVREVIRQVTARKRTDENNARVVGHRLIALLGKGSIINQEDGFVSRADLARIVGMDSSDENPVSEVDPEFNEFRKLMREIGSDLTTQSGQISAVGKLSRLALNVLTSEGELAKLGTSIEDVAPVFLAQMRGAGTIADAFSELTDSAHARLQDLYAENIEAVNLLLRGFKSKALKDEYQYMSVFGDALASSYDDTMFASAARAGGFRGMHPSITGQYKAEWSRTLSPERRAAIEEFSDNTANDSLYFAYDPEGTPSEMVNPVGAVKAITTDGDLGNGVYLKRNVDDADPDFIRDIAPSAVADDLADITNAINSVRTKLATETSNLHNLSVNGGDVSTFRNSVIYPLSRRLENLLGQEAALWRQAAAAGKRTQPRAVPFVARALNTFDLHPDTEYSFGDVQPTSLDWLLSTLESKQAVTTPVAESLRSLPSPISGKSVHQTLVDAIVRSQDVDTAMAARLLNENLRDMGYDGIASGNDLVVFDPANVRHVDDSNFNIDQSRNQTFGANERGMTADLFETMLAGNVDRDDTSGMMAKMQMMHAPAILAEPMKKILKRKDLTDGEVVKISWFTRLYNESSERFRKSGANWFADKIKPKSGVGFYEKLDAEQAKALMVSRDKQGRPISIMSMLRQIPGYQNTAYRRWMNRNKFIGTVAQPQSHAKILSAIRRGEPAVAALPKDLRDAARDVQKFFRQEIAKAWQDGLPLSYRKDYIPQVWNAESIKEDPNAFVATMRDYFMREMQRGEVPTPAGRDPRLVAEEKATMLMNTLTTDGGDGVMLPDNALRARLEDHFFERVINLRPEDLPNAERFMVNDLEGILSKYADQITRRRLLTKEFGLGNHGVSTYLNILVNGRDAVIDTLRNTKTYVKNRIAADSSLDERVQETSEIIAPIDGDEQEIGELVDTAIQMLGRTKKEWSANKEKVRSFLINAQDPAIVAQQPEFIKRIDAIVNALSEFGGRPAPIEPHEINAMTTMVAGLSKKPIDQGWTNSPAMMKFSRNARSFNNITLLGFTTLASIPDIGMPLIRSGNFGAFITGWKKYMKDPHYREMARNIGVSVESVLHERMAHMYSDTGSRLSNSFFNLTFLNQWTNIMRESSAVIGFESFKAEAKRAQDLLARGMGNSPQYVTAYRYLKRYGMEKYAERGANSLSDLDEAMKNDTLRYALMRFTNEAIFAPNPNDVPLWAQNPVGQLIFQLKSYPLMMSRMAGYTITEARQGNYRPLSYLMAAGGVLGSGSLAVRDVVQQRGDTDGDGKPDAMFRKRLASEGPIAGKILNAYNDLAEGLGLDVEAEGTMDMVLGWFSESMLVAGGFGLFADLMHTAVEQADNREYGKLRTLGWALGPTFSTASDAYGVVQAAIDTGLNEEPSNSAQRAAARSVVGRIPIAGGIKPVKETLTDMIAGEAE